MMVHEPEKPTEQQGKYLEKYFNDMEYAFSRIGHEKEDGYSDYRDYIDVQSFINYYILEEIARNPDGNFRKSTFLTKEKDRKAELYHVWDFDLTLGNCNYWGDASSQPEGWQMKDCVWNNRLFKSRKFIDGVKKTLNDKYNDLLGVQDFIYAQAELIEGAVDRNFERWPILGQYVWPNAVWYNTYEEELDYLANYYVGRLKWLKKEIDKM